MVKKGNPDPVKVPRFVRKAKVSPECICLTPEEPGTCSGRKQERGGCQEAKEEGERTREREKSERKERVPTHRTKNVRGGPAKVASYMGGLVRDILVLELVLKARHANRGTVTQKVSGSSGIGAGRHEPRRWDFVSLRDGTTHTHTHTKTDSTGKRRRRKAQGKQQTGGVKEQIVGPRGHVEAVQELRDSGSLI